MLAVDWPFHQVTSAPASVNNVWSTITRLWHHFINSFDYCRCNERSRHSSTPVWGASTKSNGKRRSEMKICGSERDRNQWPSRYCGGSGAGSDTPSAPHAKPWPGTRRGRGREASLATVGGKTLKQSWNSREPTGPEWQEQPRTECDGGGSLMAYAPLGARGISK